MKLVANNVFRTNGTGVNPDDDRLGIGWIIHARYVDLSIFFGNCAVAGALERARTVGLLHAFACAFPEANQALIWHPNTEGVAAP